MSEPAVIALWGLDPERWRWHPLHDPERTYRETNCFLDAVVEVVAGAGGVPEAMLGATAAGDFELDQWTFFKPTPDTLRSLYGIDLHEVVVHGDLERQLVVRLAAGRTLFPEVDAFHLPDTAGTTYRERHDKTSILVEAIDPERRVLRYFHNAGYFELSGDDYDAVLGRGPVEADPRPPGWAPYVDQVRFDAGPVLAGDDLHEAAWELTRAAVTARPQTDPWARLADYLGAEIEGLADADPQRFHDLAFVTARMAGSSFEVLGDHVRWLLREETGAAIVADLDAIVAGTKSLLFRMARRRPFDTAAAVAPIAVAWERGLDALDHALAGASRGRP